MLEKVMFVGGFTSSCTDGDMWPTEVDIGRDMLRYHRVPTQQTTVGRCRHDTFECIMLHLGEF